MFPEYIDVYAACVLRHSSAAACLQLNKTLPRLLRNKTARREYHPALGIPFNAGAAAEVGRDVLVWYELAQHRKRLRLASHAHLFHGTRIQKILETVPSIDPSWRRSDDQDPIQALRHDLVPVVD